MVKNKRGGGKDISASQKKNVGRNHKPIQFKQELFVAGKAAHIQSSTMLQAVTGVCDGFVSSITQVVCGTYFCAFLTGIISILANTR